MPADLERDLGLYATITISVGAMIGSGIFVLPGLAFKIAGPAVVAAYLLAGLVAMPAVLSKAEMATAMPEAGGTYLYIDRAMGPLLGTIAGVGAWFSLTFKSAFALVGLGAYLVLFSALPSKPVALALAALLLVVNVVGVKQTGRLQSVIVTAVVAVLLLFIADGITFVDSTRYHPFAPEGGGSLLAATGFVFVSYAGVTKIASVAEEVEDPGRNIPLAMIGSVLLMMLVYVFVVFVVIGVTEPEGLEGTLTPMAAAAGRFLGSIGIVVVAAVAVLALTSMANAGVLSASRFPFAMSRDGLAPPTIEYVHDGFQTPAVALLLTGALLLLLIGVVPVLELAKLASAFKILVFSLVNVALIAFRESDLASYDPEFVAPGYPWVQLFGILAGGVLLTQMGTLPLAGAAGLIVVGVVWYRVYGRERTEREGAALTAIRGSWTDRALERTRRAVESGGADRVLVPVARPPPPERREEFLGMVRLAADVAGPDGHVRVVQFEEVPEQLDLAAAAEDSPSEVEFEAEAGGILPDVGVPVEFGEVVTHDAKRSVASFADHYDVDLVLGEWHPSRWHAELLGADVDWYMRHTERDFVFVRNRGYGEVEEIAVVADRGPFDPLEVVVASGIASAHGATVRFVATLGESATDGEVEAARAYLEALSGFCDADAEVTVATAPDQIEGLVEATRDADLAVVGTAAHHVVYDVLFGTVPDRLVERLDCTVLLTHLGRTRRHTFLRAIFDRVIYRSRS